MPKKQVTTNKLRQPSGHFSQATMIEASGRLVFISGMTARRPDGTIAGIGDIEEQTRQVCENLQGRGRDRRRHARRHLPRGRLRAQHGALRPDPQSAARVFQPPLPASTMVEICKMTSPDYLIEINAIAVLADS